MGDKRLLISVDIGFVTIMPLSVGVFEATERSVFRICTAVLDRSINTGTDIYDYVAAREIGHIAEAMREAINKSLGRFLKGLPMASPA